MARRIRSFTEVAPGVFFVEGPLSNWVVLVGGTAVTLIDAGYPADLALVEQSIARAGAAPENLRQIFVTHGHSDHVGSISALVAMHAPAVFAHPDELANVRREEVHQVGFRDLLPHLWKPRTFAWTLRAVGAGGLGDVAVPTVSALETGVELPIAGHRVIAVTTSGHTPGHVAYWLPDSGIVISGDALVTAHPTSSHDGPQLLMEIFHSHPGGAANALDILGALDDVTLVLPGHGPLLRTSIRDAAKAARRAGSLCSPISSTSLSFSPGDVTYRPLHADEVDQALSLLETTSTADLAHRLRNLLVSDRPGRVHSVVVAVADGRMLGAAVAAEEPIFPGDVYTVVAVEPDARGRGIGTELASQVLAAVDTHHEKLDAMLLLRDDDPRGREFAERHGFVVAAHSLGWEFDLTDTTSAAQVLQEAAARGITVRLADRHTEADTINRVFAITMAGLPGAFGKEPQADPSRLIDHFPDGAHILFAETATEIIGIGAVHATADAHEWHTDYTGVDPRYRRQGISRILKAAELLEVAQGGGSVVGTHNDVNNTGMIAVNKAIGMKPAVGQWWFVRRASA